MNKSKESFERKLKYINIKIMSAKYDYMVTPNMYRLWCINNLNKYKNTILKKIY